MESRAVLFIDHHQVPGLRESGRPADHLLEVGEDLEALPGHGGRNRVGVVHPADGLAAPGGAPVENVLLQQHGIGDAQLRQVEEDAASHHAPADYHNVCRRPHFAPPPPVFVEGPRCVVTYPPPNIRWQARSCLQAEPGSGYSRCQDEQAGMNGTAAGMNGIVSAHCLTSGFRQNNRRNTIAREVTGRTIAKSKRIRWW